MTVPVINQGSLALASVPVSDPFSNIVGANLAQGSQTMDYQPAGASAVAATIRNAYGTYIPGVDTPTFTPSAAGAASTITGSVLLAPTNAAFTYFGGTNIAASGAYYVNKTDGGSDQLKPFNVEFTFDGDEFEFVHQAVGNSRLGYQLLEDGRPTKSISQVTVSPSGTTGTYLVKVSFTVARPRVLTLNIDNGFGGLYFNPLKFMVGKSNRVRLGGKLGVLADSWVGGSNAGTFVASYADELTRTLGFGELINLAQPGTGYLNNGGGGARAVYGDATRVARIPADLDYLLIAGSVNDIGQPSYTTLVGPAATALYAAIKAARPNLKLIVAGSQFVNLYAAANHDAIDSQLLAASSAASNVVGFISCKGWLTGSGTTAAPTGDGNSDFYVTSDRLHLVAAGAQYWQMRMAHAARPLITT